MEEVKARVRDLEEVESKIKSLGGELEREFESTDIYFSHPSKVLKIRKEDENEFLVKFEKTEKGFRKVQERKVEDFSELKSHLEEKYGVKRVLQKNARYFSWRGYDILLISFDGLGDFVVVQSGAVSRKIFSKLGIVVLNYVEKPFSELEH